MTGEEAGLTLVNDLLRSRQALLTSQALWGPCRNNEDSHKDNLPLWEWRNVM